MQIEIEINVSSKVNLSFKCVWVESIRFEFGWKNEYLKLPWHEFKSLKLCRFSNFTPTNQWDQTHFMDKVEPTTCDPI